MTRTAEYYVVTRNRDFLADRTKSRAHGTMCRLYVVCLSVCNVYTL